MIEDLVASERVFTYSHVSLLYVKLNHLPTSLRHRKMWKSGTTIADWKLTDPFLRKTKLVLANCDETVEAEVGHDHDDHHRHLDHHNRHQHDHHDQDHG